MWEARIVIPILLISSKVFGYHGTGESDSTADTSFTEEDFQTFLSSQATEDVKDTSFCEEDFSRFLDMESSYTEEDWKSFLDARKDEDDEFMCDIEEQETGESDSTAETSFTEEDFESFISSQASEDVRDTSFCEEDFCRFLDVESSYTEEDWKSFSGARKDEDDEFMSDVEEQESTLLSETTEGSGETVDPEFFGEIYALPRFHSLTFGETPSRESSLMRKALDKEDIMRSKNKKCKCDKNCMGMFSAKDIYNLRERYWTNTRRAQFQILIHTMGQQYKKGSFFYLPLDNGKTVCVKAFKLILKVNKNALTEAKKSHQRGAKSTAGKSPKSVSHRTEQTISWFEMYAEFHGDRMPHSRDVLLPYKTTKVGVFQSYRTQVEEASRVSATLFYKIWKERFPHVKIKEVNSFTQCSKCAGLGKKLEQTMVPSERAELTRQRKEHYDRQMLERKYYYQKRDRSRADPENYISLIIDGMDQAKTNLPHFTGRKPKNINPSDLLKTHITGVINHGQRHFDTFMDMNQWPHDPNLTINVLLLALQKAALMSNRLPGTLYIQADNCFRENKNRYVLSFCELLVHENIFNEVHLSFLPVGHTHEDVDAGFSQISGVLREQDVETYEELMNILPNPTDLTSVFDVKAWLEPHISSPQKHSVPLHFRFSRSDETVSVYYKGLHNQPWKALEGSFFKAYANGKPSLPTGSPKLLKPQFDSDDLERLKKQISNIKHLFSSDDKYEWWSTFIENIQSKQLPVMEWMMKKLPRQQNKDRESSGTNAVPPALREMLNKELEEPQVNIVKSSRLKTRGHPSRKKKPTGQPKQKPKGSGKRRRTILVNKNSVLIQLDTDQKKHIWFMILYLLISNLMLTYLLQTLVLLYMLLWNNISKLGIYHMVLEWLAKQYLAEYLARSNIKDYFHCLSEWYIIHEINLLHVRLEYAVHSHQESCNCL